MKVLLPGIHFQVKRGHRQTPQNNIKSKGLFLRSPRVIRCLTSSRGKVFLDLI